MEELIKVFRRYFRFLRGHQIEDLVISIEIVKIMKLMNSDDLSELNNMTYEEALSRLNASQ
jgi:hypothetical protein